MYLCIIQAGMPYPAFMANGVQSAKHVTQKTTDYYDY